MNAGGTAKKPDARNRALAAIHIAKTQLAMDDDAYRAFLRRVSAECGAEVDSAARLDRRQTRAVLNALRHMGAARPGAHKPGSYPGTPHNFASPAMPNMITKIEAQLADMHLSWAYADAIAKRQTGIPRCAWVRDEKQLRGIIAALDVEQCKRGMNAFIDDAVHRLGLTDKQFLKLVAGMPKNWRRSTRYLRIVSMNLEAQLEMLVQQERA